MNGQCDKRRNFQLWPDKGKLASQQNLTLKELMKKLGNECGVVHAYVVSTIERAQNGFSERFRQTGCAPNFQGGRITLCTCRHDLHMFNQNREDPAKKFNRHWYVGFTGNKFDQHKHYLFYIMKIEKAFYSHAQIFAYLDPKVRKAKNATLNVFGDIYQPKSNISDEWNPTYYERPKIGHKHYECCEDNRWHKDIKYKGPNKRSAPLIGDYSCSFLWSRPLICKKSDFSNHIKGQIYGNPQELLSDLEHLKC